MLAAVSSAAQFSLALAMEIDNQLRPKNKYVLLRSLSGLCHLVPPATQLLSISQIFYLSLHPSNEDIVSIPNVPLTQSQFLQLAIFLGKALLRTKLQRVPLIDYHNKRCMMWNLASLRDLKSVAAANKLRIIACHLQHGPVLLLETKADSTWEQRIMTQFGTVRVASTPAVQVPLDAPSERLSPDNTPQGFVEQQSISGPRGGVAIISPSHILPGSCSTRILVPGYAVQLTLQCADSSVTYVAAYFRPTQELAILKSLSLIHI